MMVRLLLNIGGVGRVGQVVDLDYDAAMRLVEAKVAEVEGAPDGVLWSEEPSVDAGQPSGSREPEQRTVTEDPVADLGGGDGGGTDPVGDRDRPRRSGGRRVREGDDPR